MGGRSINFASWVLSAMERKLLTINLRVEEDGMGIVEGAGRGTVQFKVWGSWPAGASVQRTRGQGWVAIRMT